MLEKQLELGLTVGDQICLPYNNRRLCGGPRGETEDAACIISAIATSTLMLLSATRSRTTSAQAPGNVPAPQKAKSQATESFLRRGRGGKELKAARLSNSAIQAAFSFRSSQVSSGQTVAGSVGDRRQKARPAAGPPVVKTNKAAFSGSLSFDRPPRGSVGRVALPKRRVLGGACYPGRPAGARCPGGGGGGTAYWRDGSQGNQTRPRDAAVQLAREPAR